MAELTSLELTADLIAWSRDEPYPERDEHPVWRWERWIWDDPERAWRVFEELVRQAPDDVEVLERVAQRLEQVAFRHRADFLERAIRLYCQRRCSIAWSVPSCSPKATTARGIATSTNWRRYGCGMMPTATPVIA
jgi:hypothetical protein